MFTDLTKNQREKLAEKVMDWGNLVFVGLTVAQFVPGPFNPQAVIFIIFGYISLITAYFVALRLMRGGDKQ